MLVDTHCHIHDSEFKFEVPAVIERAKVVGVERMICIGTSVADSAQAVEFVQAHSECWASVGLHPHDAKLGNQELSQLDALAAKSRVVAIGECGLDYYYHNSSRDQQAAALRYQIELAQSLKKPLIFHVREAFADFYKIFDDYPGLTGVVHSFSSTTEHLQQALERGLYVSLNGIMTFTKDEAQLAAARAVPLAKLVLETDAPFLTPTPYRGKVNEPARVAVVAKFLADLRGESLEQLAQATTLNAIKLFNLSP